MCTDGCYNNAGTLDDLWNEAVNAVPNQKNQILKAKDAKGDTPIQKCARFGNPTALKWVIDKWDEEGIKINLEKRDN